MHPSFPHRLRASVESSVRAWFSERDVLEVQCSSIVANPGLEPELDAFAICTRRGEAGRAGWLHTSPEYAIKATMASLDTDLYTLARVYRDEASGALHHTEFTMLEWYRRGTSMAAFMTECEALVRCVMRDASLLPEAKPLPEWLSADEPFERASMEELFHRHVGAPLLGAERGDLAEAARALGYAIAEDWDRQTLFSLLHGIHLEAHMAQERPLFVHGFPAWQSALAELDPADPRQALRFELYLPWRERGQPRAMELANAFVELRDPVEQRARFCDELSQREAMGRAVYPMPEALLRGIAELPPTCGVALGLERLLVWLADALWGRRLQVRDFLLGSRVQPTGEEEVLSSRG